jgi:hypothetical protein
MIVFDFIKIHYDTIIKKFGKLFFEKYFLLDFFQLFDSIVYYDEFFYFFKNTKISSVYIDRGLELLKFNIFIKNNVLVHLKSFL